MIDFLIAKKKIRIKNRTVTIKRGCVVSYYALLAIVLNENLNELDYIMKDFVDSWWLVKRWAPITELIEEILKFNTIKKNNKKQETPIEKNEIETNLQNNLLSIIAELSHYFNFSIDEILEFTNPQIEYLLYEIRKIRAQDYGDYANAAAMNPKHFNEILGKYEVRI